MRHQGEAVRQIDRGKKKDHPADFFWAHCIFWKEFERQVRIEGMIEKISSEESERYFKSRPFFSQIGAIVSPQSQLIQHRDELEMAIKFFEENPDKVQRPEHWGGYKLIPDYFEFWQGRENRLHDRFQYQLKNDIWEINCIAP